MKSSGPFTNSRTISLLIGFALLMIFLPGVVSADSSPPNAQFTASATEGNAPLIIQFTDLTGSTGTTVYKWDMNNDGITDYTTKDPAHLFTVPGTYTVKLTVVTTQGTDTEIKQIYYHTNPYGLFPLQHQTNSNATPAPVTTGAPKAQFTASTTQGQSPLTVTFADQSTGSKPMTYHWDFSDGTGNLPENSQQNPTWRFWDTVATSYTVRLTVTNAYGSDTIVKHNYITLGTSGRPAATPTPTPQRTATPTPAPTPKPTATPAPNGVSTGPDAEFTASATRGNAPMTVRFTDLTGSTGTTIYKWDINNDGVTDYTTKPVHTFSAGI